MKQAGVFIWTSQAVLCVYLTAEADQVLFFDAVESVDELESIDDNSRPKTKDPRLVELQNKLIKICQNKAATRNKKVTILLTCIRSKC